MNNVFHIGLGHSIDNKLTYSGAMRRKKTCLCVSILSVDPCTMYATLLELLPRPGYVTHWAVSYKWTVVIGLDITLPKRAGELPGLPSKTEWTVSELMTNILPQYQLSWLQQLHSDCKRTICLVWVQRYVHVTHDCCWNILHNNRTSLVSMVLQECHVRWFHLLLVGILWSYFLIPRSIMKRVRNTEVRISLKCLDDVP